MTLKLKPYQCPVCGSTMKPVLTAPFLRYGYRIVIMDRGTGLIDAMPDHWNCYTCLKQFQVKEAGIIVE